MEEPEQRNERRKLGRLRKNLLLTAGCLLLLLVAAHLVFSVVESRRLRSAVARAERDWGPLDPTSLTLPPVPESRNMTKIFRAASDVLDLSAADKRLLGLLASQGRRGPSIDALTLDDSSEEWKRIDDIMSRNALAFEILSKVIERDRSNWEIPYAKGFRARLPDMMPLVQLGRLIRVRAMLYAREGHMTEAAEALKPGFALAGSLRREPLLLLQLLGQGFHAGMCGTLRDVMGQGALERKELQGLESILAETSEPAPRYAGLLGDMKCAQSAVSRVMEGKGADIETFSSGYDGQLGRGNRPGILRAPLLWLGRPFLWRTQSCYLEGMSRVLEELKLPRYQRSSLNQGVSNGKPPEELSCGWGSFLFEVGIANLNIAILRGDLAEARGDLARLALALERFSQDRGSYPTTLDDLVPHYLDQVPLDPFTGAPPRYSLQGSGFILESAGNEQGLALDLDPILRWER